jgi:Fe-S-cluster-containing hydrogenase component 2
VKLETMETQRQGPANRRHLAVAVDPDLCNGCRTCELACSFHHAGVMSPELSSVQVRRSNRTAAIQWLVTPSCDLCAGEEQPLCEKYCGCHAIRLETSAKGGTG